MLLYWIIKVYMLSMGVHNNTVGIQMQCLFMSTTSLYFPGFDNL
jgi:hypothetical protein